MAAPLHWLTQEDTPFQWTQVCEESFQRLKASLTEAPVLAYPKLTSLTNWPAPWYCRQMPANRSGGCSKARSVSEWIGQLHTHQSRGKLQHECLAIVWAMKQFRHYLLGHTFQLMTDHARLQWLGEQKMEGHLCRWALAIQVFSFEIMYKKGSTDGNADALSRMRGPDMEHSMKP